MRTFLVVWCLVAWASLGCGSPHSAGNPSAPAPAAFGSLLGIRYVIGTQFQYDLHARSLVWLLPYDPEFVHAFRHAEHI